MLTKLYAARLAPEGILVHEVRPGVIATDMTTTVQEKYDRLIAQGRFPLRGGARQRTWQTRSPCCAAINWRIPRATIWMWTAVSTFVSCDLQSKKR